MVYLTTFCRVIELPINLLQARLSHKERKLEE